MSESHVLFIADLCRELKVARRTVERLRRHGAFPIPELLPALDKRPRWSRTEVQRYLDGTATAGRSSWRRRAG